MPNLYTIDRFLSRPTSQARSSLGTILRIECYEQKKYMDLISIPSICTQWLKLEGQPAQAHSLSQAAQEAPNQHKVIIPYRAPNRLLAILLACLCIGSRPVFSPIFLSTTIGDFKNVKHGDPGSPELLLLLLLFVLCSLLSAKLPGDSEADSTSSSARRQGSTMFFLRAPYVPRTRYEQNHNRGQTTGTGRRRQRCTTPHQRRFLFVPRRGNNQTRPKSVCCALVSRSRYIGA